MSTKRKKRPLIYNKVVDIYCIEPTTEQKVKAIMVAHNINSISAAIRYQLEHRQVDIHFIEYSLDDTMWLFAAIRTELQLLEISIVQIKIKLAKVHRMHVSGNLIDPQLFNETKMLMDVKTKKIFDIIFKLSYLWLPK